MKLEEKNLIVERPYKKVYKCEGISKYGDRKGLDFAEGILE